MSSATFTDLTITNTNNAICGIGAPLYVQGSVNVAKNMCVQNGAYMANGIALQPTGNINTASGVLTDIGGRLIINILEVTSTGLTARSGTTTFTAGTTGPILNNTLTTKTSVLVTRFAPASPSTNTGFIIPTITTTGIGGSFIIQSTNVLDNGSVNWWLIEQA